MRAALHMAMNAGLVKAWRRWEECVEERSRLLDLAGRVMRRMRARVQAAVFGAAAEKAAAAVEAREGRLRHAVVMMHLRVVQLCFRAWADASLADVATREGNYRRAIGMFGHTVLTKCVRAWVAMYEEERALKAAAATKWLSGMVGVAFRTWEDAARRKKAQRMRLRAMAIRMARRLEVVFRSGTRRQGGAGTARRLARWVNDELSAGFLRWADQALVAGLARVVAKAAFARYAGGLLIKCFFNWASLVRSELGRRDEAMSRVLEFLSGRRELLLASRYAAWRQLALRARDEREAKLRLAVLRMRQRLASMAWLAWVEYHQEAAHARRAAACWVNGSLARLPHMARVLGVARDTRLGTTLLARWTPGCSACLLLEGGVKLVAIDREAAGYAARLPERARRDHATAALAVGELYARHAASTARADHEGAR